jgi:hypothetical protein
MDYFKKPEYPKAYEIWRTFDAGEKRIKTVIVRNNIEDQTFYSSESKQLNRIVPRRLNKAEQKRELKLLEKISYNVQPWIIAVVLFFISTSAALSVSWIKKALGLC